MELSWSYDLYYEFCRLAVFIQIIFLIIFLILFFNIRLVENYTL